MTASGPNDLKKGPNDDVGNPVVCVFAYPKRNCCPDVVNTVLLYGFLRTLFLYKTEGTTFKNTNLNRAKFDQSSLKNCSFEGSSLDHASFSHAVLRKCSFTDANISYVNWRYSQFILLNYFTSHCNLLEKNIRTLCTTGNGNRGDYQNADLKQRQFKNETHQPQELTEKGSSGTV